MIPFALVAIFSKLQLPETRAEGVAELASLTGTRDILLFGKDTGINVYLPAPGLPQTLKRGVHWQNFLLSCEKQGVARGNVPALDDDQDEPALGIADKSGLSVLVFLGKEPGAEELEQVHALLPLLGARLSLERAAFAAEGQAAAAREASKRAGALNEALNASRRELQRAYERAELELASRREAERKLLEADRRKDEFLAMLAHELRNPLAPISMAAQILKASAVDSARINQTSRIIERQVRHMASLLDDLLDVSRVTRGTVVLDKEPVDVSLIVADAVEQVRPLIEARGQRLGLQLPHETVQVLGDRIRLVQVLANLLNNAAKYTEKTGHILLKIESDQELAKFHVRDSGIGIDEKLLPHVFELFSQGQRSPDRSQGGLGIGLALAKSLVELHGGSIRVYSEGPGKGSEFSVELPRLKLKEEDMPRAPVASMEKQDAGALRIMIVDDNLDAGQTMGAYLEASGHKVWVACDARSALDKVREAAPQVLLIDIGLPDIDGCELARRLRMLPETGRSMFVALTGYGREEDYERSRLAGFSCHLTKPADTAILTRLLSEASHGFLT